MAPKLDGGALGLMIAGGVIAALLFVFVNHGYAGSGECYYIGQATFGQRIQCYSPTQYRGAWLVAVALFAIGVFLMIRSNGRGDTK